MPVHNGARFLRAAIESVLAQTFTDFELLVVDDQSTDESRSIARAISDPRLRLIEGDVRRGLAGTLNVGLRAAVGDYVARLDQDDLSHTDRIRKQVAFLDSHPEIALVGSLARLIDESGRDMGTVTRPVSAIGIRWYSLIENPLIHSTVMFRRDVALQLGGYDDSLAYAEDYDLWGRFLRSHRVENLSEHLVDYRRWSSSMMSSVETAPDNPKRTRLREIMASLVARRINDELGEHACTAADGALLATFTLGIDQRRRREFLALFTDVRRRFEMKWREAQREPDYWRVLAGQYDAIAYRLTPPSRLAAARTYAHACLSAPRTVARLPWARATALMVLGREGRERLGGALTRAA